MWGRPMVISLQNWSNFRRGDYEFLRNHLHRALYAGRPYLKAVEEPRLSAVKAGTPHRLRRCSRFIVSALGCVFFRLNAKLASIDSTGMNLKAFEPENRLGHGDQTRQGIR